jgi:hypothetical protein
MMQFSRMLLDKQKTHYYDDYIVESYRSRRAIMQNLHSNLQRNGGSLLKAAGVLAAPIAVGSAHAVTGASVVTTLAPLAPLATNPITLPLAVAGVAGVVGVAAYLHFKDK